MCTKAMKSGVSLLIAAVLWSLTALPAVAHLGHAHEVFAVSHVIDLVVPVTASVAFYPILLLTSDVLGPHDRPPRDPADGAASPTCPARHTADETCNPHPHRRRASFAANARLLVTCIGNQSGSTPVIEEKTQCIGANF